MLLRGRKTACLKPSGSAAKALRGFGGRGGFRPVFSPGRSRNISSASEGVPRIGRAVHRRVRNSLPDTRGGSSSGLADWPADSRAAPGPAQGRCLMTGRAALRGCPSSTAGFPVRSCRSRPPPAGGSSRHNASSSLPGSRDSRGRARHNRSSVHRPRRVAAVPCQSLGAPS